MNADVAASEDAPKFSRLIRQYRIRVGLTQRELADLSTISVRAIRDLELGRARRPRQDTVRLIADGLRLGPRARAALQTAADQGRTVWALKAVYDAESPGPPTALDPIAGRESEISVIEGELSSGAERLINVVGLSGVGKTRLALEVATRLHAGVGLPVLWSAFSGGGTGYRPAGAAESLSDLVRACVDDVFTPGGAGNAAVTAPRHDDQAGVAAFTELAGDRPALLVVDGAGRREPRIDGLARLLRDCPGLRLLVTSDRPSGVHGERPFLLTPLEPPSGREERDPETLERVPAVRLFLDRVRRIRPEYVLAPSDVGLVADICRRLDGLPLALQAAASWLLVYDLQTLHRCLETGPANLLDHLAGTDGSFRIREALHRSIRCLPAGDRVLLTALCELGGEFDLGDVAVLTGQSLPDCGRVVHSLLLHGLVRRCYRAGRFVVPNIVRAFQLTALRPIDVGCEWNSATAAGMPEERLFTATLPRQLPVGAGCRS